MLFKLNHIGIFVFPFILKRVYFFLFFTFVTLYYRAKFQPMLKQCSIPLMFLLSSPLHACSKIISEIVSDYQRLTATRGLQLDQVKMERRWLLHQSYQAALSFWSMEYSPLQITSYKLNKKRNLLPMISLNSNGDSRKMKDWILK